MSKSKNTTEISEIYAGADFLKSGFGKTTKILETTAKFGKGNIEALVESATIAGEGFRTIGNEIGLYSKKSFEESAVATKAIMSSKSIHEAIELQTSFAKMAFGAYMGQLKILTELSVGTAKDAYAPVQERFAAVLEIAQSATAA
jgi:phasin family protein